MTPTPTRCSAAASRRRATRSPATSSAATCWPCGRWTEIRRARAGDGRHIGREGTREGSTGLEGSVQNTDAVHLRLSLPSMLATSGARVCKRTLEERVRLSLASTLTSGARVCERSLQERAWRLWAWRSLLLCRQLVRLPDRGSRRRRGSGWSARRSAAGRPFVPHVGLQRGNNSARGKLPIQRRSSRRLLQVRQHAPRGRCRGSASSVLEHSSTRESLHAESTRGCILGLLHDKLRRRRDAERIALRAIRSHDRGSAALSVRSAGRSATTATAVAAGGVVCYTSEPVRARARGG